MKIILTVFAVLLPLLSYCQYEDLEEEKKKSKPDNLVVCYFDQPMDEMFDRVTRRLFLQGYDLTFADKSVGIIQTDYNPVIDSKILQVMPSLSFYISTNFMEIKGKYRTDATGGFWGGGVAKNLFKPDIIKNEGRKKSPAQRSWQMMLSFSDMCLEVETDKI